MVTFNFTAFKKCAYLISDSAGVKQDLISHSLQWENFTYIEHDSFCPGKYALFKKGN